MRLEYEYLYIFIRGRVFNNMKNIWSIICLLLLLFNEGFVCSIKVIYVSLALKSCRSAIQETFH